VPARRRRGFAVPGHIEGDDTVTAGDARIVHQRAVLTSVGSGAGRSFASASLK
jgi:hypothetical protein